MLYHASQTPNISTLTPHTSNHGTPLTYFSSKRENVLVYLSNAVEKHCREQAFPHSGSYHKWGSYGFTKDGLLRLDEYYPNATRDTYQGAVGYIYTVEENALFKSMEDIPFAFTSTEPVPITSCEPVPDAYDALLSAAKAGKIQLTSYEQNSPQMLDWIKTVITEEYEKYHDAPEYRFFLKSKFDFLS